MSDMIDLHRDLKAAKRALRKAYGKPCPGCAQARPKADATILLPGQRCRVDGYVDPRPALTDEQERAAYRIVEPSNA